MRNNNIRYVRHYI